MVDDGGGRGGEEGDSNGGEAAINKEKKEKRKRIRFPPGYRFCPDDDELILHYLNNKLSNLPLPYNVFNDVNLYNYNPDDLVETYKKWGENKWYFFTPRERKYPNGSRPKRAAGNGYWKATGVDKEIIHNNEQVGVRKALVFYIGKPGKCGKTDWVMHEYINADGCQPVAKPDGSMRLNEWVLCTIEKKRGCNEESKDGKETEKHSPSKAKKTPKPQQGGNRSVKSQNLSRKEDIQGPVGQSYRTIVPYQRGFQVPNVPSFQHKVEENGYHYNVDNVTTAQLASDPIMTTITQMDTYDSNPGAQMSIYYSNLQPQMGTYNSNTSAQMDTFKYPSTEMCDYSSDGNAQMSTYNSYLDDQIRSYKSYLGSHDLQQSFSSGPPYLPQEMDLQPALKKHRSNETTHHMLKEITDIDFDSLPSIPSMPFLDI